MATFLGLMMGAGGASNSAKGFAVQVARPAVQKKIANTALTKTAWYPPVKTSLRFVGIHVTKQSFAKTVTKVVPVVGGVVSGGVTFWTLNGQSKRLMKHLREMPPPNADAVEYMDALRRADQDAKGDQDDFPGETEDAEPESAANQDPGGFRTTRDRNRDKGVVSKIGSSVAGATGRFDSMVRRQPPRGALSDATESGSVQATGDSDSANP